MPHADYQAFARALCDPAFPPPAGLQVAAADVGERFAIYRNNVHVSLVDALGERYPVAQRMVGEEFFRAMARGYVLKHKPDTPVLAYYGDRFPEFIEHYPPAMPLPFLGDLARLERDWSRAWAAADEPVLAYGDLAKFSATELAAARIRPHAAAHLIRSSWPVADLWQAHQQAAPDLSSLQWRAQDVLVTRPEADIQLHLLDAGAAAVAQALIDGRAIDEAAAQAMDTDMGAVLGLLINCGMIAEVRST